MIVSFLPSVVALSEDFTIPTVASLKLHVESPRSNCCKIEKIMLLPAEQLQTIVGTLMKNGSK
jgi:hypothetical protein